MLHVRYQNNQELSLINIITVMSNHMTVTRDEMDRKEAGSRVMFRVTIPTNVGDRVPDCIEDISSQACNFRPYHRLSAGSHFGNTSQKGCFGGAPALG